MTSLPDKIIPFQQPATGNLPVYSEETETALIGAVLVNPSVFDRCNDITTGTQAFFLLNNALIWKAMTTLVTERTAIDLATVTDKLRSTGDLDKIGGPATLTTLIRNVPTSVHAEVYAKVVQKAYVRRGLQEAGQVLTGLAGDGTQPIEALAEHLDKIRAIYEQITDTAPERAGESALIAYLAEVEAARANPGAYQGITTGFPVLSNIIPGWMPSKLITIGGLTHLGKTSSMIAFTLAAALDGVSVDYYNVADGNKRDVIARMIAHLCGVAPIKQLRGTMNESEYIRFLTGVDKFQSLPIYIEDTYGMTPLQIANQSLMGKREHDTRLVVIDYFQRLQLANPPKTRVQELGKISSLLAKMAKSLDLPVMIGAQVGHHIAERQNKRPYNSDIKDCKQLAEDSDVVLFVHREGHFVTGHNPHEVEFIIAKNKISGQVGTAYAFLDTETGSILPAERIDPDRPVNDIPM